MTLCHRPRVPCDEVPPIRPQNGSFTARILRRSRADAVLAVGARRSSLPAAHPRVMQEESPLSSLAEDRAATAAPTAPRRPVQLRPTHPLRGGVFRARHRGEPTGRRGIRASTPRRSKAVAPTHLPPRGRRLARPVVSTGARGDRSAPLAARPSLPGSPTDLQVIRGPTSAAPPSREPRTMGTSNQLRRRPMPASPRGPLAWARGELGFRSSAGLENEALSRRRGERALPNGRRDAQRDHHDDHPDGDGTVVNAIPHPHSHSALDTSGTRGEPTTVPGLSPAPRSARRAPCPCLGPRRGGATAVVPRGPCHRAAERAARSGPGLEGRISPALRAARRARGTETTPAAERAAS
jgi:hypothetical protein